MCATWLEEDTREVCAERDPPSPLGKCATERSTFTRSSPPKKTFSSSVLVLVEGSKDPCRAPLSPFIHSVSYSFRHAVFPTLVPLVFVNREREREREEGRNFSFDTSPWRSISPSTRLFSSTSILYFVCRAFWTELIRDNRCSFTMSLLFFFHIVGKKLEKFYQFVEMFEKQRKIPLEN